MENNFLIYLLEISGVFIALYFFYCLCLKGMTFHNTNRMILLLMIPLSFAVPHISIDFVSNYSIANTTVPLLTEDFESINIPKESLLIKNEVINLEQLLLVIYILGFGFKFLALLWSVVKLMIIKRKATVVAKDQFSIMKANVSTAFSCFNWIFLPINSSNDEELIIEHEKNHSRVMHSFDLIISEIFIAIFWFNPFVYFFRRDLKSVHEFQVDSMLLQSGIKKSDYLQIMLSNLVFNHRVEGLYSYFNGLIIKKRVEMITRNKSTKWQLIRYILLLPIIGVMTMSFVSNDTVDIPSISPIKKESIKRISAGFGMRIHPITKEKKMHNGLDIAASKGVEIIATADGIVTMTDFNKDTYGRMVTINHGGEFETFYTQMSGFAVEKGDKVKRGQVVGYVGSSGHSAGPHLHYEVHKEGKSVNPQDYIND